MNAAVFQHLVELGVRLSDSDVFDSCVSGLGGGQRTASAAGCGSSGVTQIFGAFDVVVGMRFHSLVIAALCGIPFVGVGDDHKLRDICSAYGMPHIALSTLKAEDLVSSVNLAHGMRPNAKVTWAMSASAAANFEVLEKWLR